MRPRGAAIPGDDDPDAATREAELARLRRAPFSYPEVGASAGRLPAGYRHTEVERSLGRGRERFDLAVERLMTWDMHRRAGLRLRLLARSTVYTGDVAVLCVHVAGWPIRAPVRIVDVVAEPTVRGFAYGTLPGHPESGEERFLVHLDPDEGVRASIRAFSRPARWFSRLGAPAARFLQDRTTRRYLEAL